MEDELESFLRDALGQPAKKVKEEPGDSEEVHGTGVRGRPDQQWRCDKRGNLLSPEALYMRFYRSVRSFLSALRGAVFANAEASPRLPRILCLTK